MLVEEFQGQQKTFQEKHGTFWIQFQINVYKDSSIIKKKKNKILPEPMFYSSLVQKYI